MTDISRREALQRAAVMFGGVLSASTIAGVLAGCAEEAAKTAATTPWVPKTLTADQRTMVVAIAEAIIPTTDTPGAKDAHVDRFVDAMLTSYATPEESKRFLAGLARVEARAQRAHSTPFNQLSPEQQTTIVAELDRHAFTEKPPATTPEAPSQSKSPTSQQSDVQVGQGVGANPADAVIPPPDPEDIGPQSFFRIMKELAVVGYYTSEVGATKELRVSPMTRYRDIPYTPGTPSWA
jgi:gluconate 2-dehydrogenase gamma chain